MQKGSLVSPSARMLEEMPYMMNKFGFTFSPSMPTKDSVYVCTVGPYISPSGGICIEVDGLKVYAFGAIQIHLNTFLFDEIESPVDVEEIVEEEVVTS